MTNPSNPHPDPVEDADPISDLRARIAASDPTVAGAKVRLFRTDRGRRGFVTDYNADEFDISLVQADFGAGEYYAQPTDAKGKAMKGGGGFVISGSQGYPRGDRLGSLVPPPAPQTTPAPPAVAAPMDMMGMFSLMFQQQNAAAQRQQEMLLALMTKQSSESLKATDLLAMMDKRSSVGDLREALKLAGELRGERGDDDDDDDGANVWGRIGLEFAKGFSRRNDDEGADTDVASRPAAAARTAPQLAAAPQEHPWRVRASAALKWTARLLSRLLDSAAVPWRDAVKQFGEQGVRMMLAEQIDGAPEFYLRGVSVELMALAGAAPIAPQAPTPAASKESSDGEGKQGGEGGGQGEQAGSGTSGGSRAGDDGVRRTGDGAGSQGPAGDFSAARGDGAERGGDGQSPGHPSGKRSRAGDRGGHGGRASVA